MPNALSNFLQSAFFLISSYLGLYPQQSGLNLAHQPPALIPREVLYGNPHKTSVTISPHGDYVAFLAPLDGVLNIFVQSLVDDPSGKGLQLLGKAKPVTFQKGRGVLGYQWTLKKGILLYNQDKGGDENQRLYKLDVKTSTAQELIGAKNALALVMAMSERLPDTLIVGINDRNPQLHDVYRVNLTSGHRQLLLINAGFKDFIFDNDLRLKLVGRSAPDAGTELLAPIPDLSGVIREWQLYRHIPFQDDGSTKILGFSKDNKMVYWAESKNRDLTALVLKDFVSPDSEGELIFEPEKSDIESVVSHPTENTPIAVFEHYLKPKMTLLDQKYAKDFETIQAIKPSAIPIPSGNTLDFQRILVRMASDNAASEYFVFDRKTKKSLFLFRSRDDFANYKFAKLHPREVRSRDNLTQVCYLSLPRESDPLEVGRPLAPVPLVLKVHGGPWERDRWGFDSDNQFLTNRGYGVLSCNFRGSTGFGKKFIQASFGEWAGKMHLDLVDAVNWAVSNKIADPKRVAIYGGSYGGYATLIGMTFTPELFKCGIDVVGPSSLVSLIESIPPYWAPLYNSFVKRIGGDPRTPEGREYLRRRSPLYFADRIQAPLLIGQGANDPRVKQKESDQIVAELKKNRIPVSYIVFPDEGHSFVRPDNRLAFQAASEFFFRDCLGGRVEGLKGEFARSSAVLVEKGNLNFFRKR